MTGLRRGAKGFRLEIKSLEEDGAFVGLASVYGNVDQVDEVVDAGAFKRTFDRMGNTFPLLDAHNSAEVIGTVEVLNDGPVGLEVKGRLVLEVQRAREIYALLRAQAIKGLSIGYNVVKDKMVGKIRHLVELALREVSVTAFPANLEARVLAVKDTRREAVRQAIETLNALLEDEEGDPAAAGEGSEDSTAAKGTQPPTPGPGDQVQDPPAVGASYDELVRQGQALLADMTLAAMRR
jgi:hypothetical protein